jgi:cellulose synthase/poly-beta-1,6-N-acetylglucosamine synthase-like glycosyltransferase
MALLRGLFWISAGGLAWTHAGYPLAAAALARYRERAVRRGAITPSVSLIVAAHDEEDVIERRVANLLALDYPSERILIAVASDGSGDRTDELVERISADEPRVRLIRAARAGKVAAQDLAVRETSGEIVAFSDANATWAPDALSKLVRSFADPDVAYVCGRLSLERPEGTNREGAYWRYELWLRERESALGSVTGGNGSIYAVRRADYVEVDPRFGHDLALPYLMVQRGRRAVYEPQALGFEKPSRDLEDEYRRKVRMFEHCWLIVLEGRMFRDVDPLYLTQLVSHRLLRYGSGLLHLGLLAASVPLARRGGVYRLALGSQMAGLALAAAGRARLPLPGAALAYYYTLVSAATVTALVRYVRFGVPAVWGKTEGTR